MSSLKITDKTFRIAHNFYVRIPFWILWKDRAMETWIRFKTLSIFEKALYLDKSSKKSKENTIFNGYSCP